MGSGKGGGLAYALADPEIKDWIADLPQRAQNVVLLMYELQERYDSEFAKTFLDHALPLSASTGGKRAELMRDALAHEHERKKGSVEARVPLRELQQVTEEAKEKSATADKEPKGRGSRVGLP